jgi:hypothetical protein
MLCNVKKKSLAAVPSANGGDFQERSEKKTKSHSPTFQQYHSHAEKPSPALFLIIKLCRLVESTLRGQIASAASYQVAGQGLDKRGTLGRRKRDGHQSPAQHLCDSTLPL